MCHAASSKLHQWKRGSFFYRIKISIGYSLIWSLSNNDDNDDVSENGKKTKGLDQQNSNSARASRFFVHFFAVTARLRRETA